MVEVLKALAVMTCWWHQDIEQSLFSARGSKVRQPIHWPCDLFLGPPANYNHNESYVYAGSAQRSLRWALQTDPKDFRLVSSAAFLLTLSLSATPKCFLVIARWQAVLIFTWRRDSQQKRPAFTMQWKSFRHPTTLKESPWRHSQR